MANRDRLRMAVRADTCHPGQFDEPASGLDIKLGVAAAGNPQPDPSRREMRNLRVVQKMHHVMNSGFFNCAVIPPHRPAVRRRMLRAPDSGLPVSHGLSALQLYDNPAGTQFRIPLRGSGLPQFGSDAT